MKTLTAQNLAEAADKTVGLPATVGYNIGRGYRELPLAVVTNHHPQLGNDAFTCIVFTTSSGNVYHIWQPDEGDRTWLMANLHDNLGRGRKNIVGYRFPAAEALKVVLRVGSVFRYGDVGRTTTVTAILAVNGNRCYQTAQAKNMFLQTDIIRDFFRQVSP